MKPTYQKFKEENANKYRPLVEVDPAVLDELIPLNFRHALMPGGGRRTVRDYVSWVWEKDNGKVLILLHATEHMMEAMGSNTEEDLDNWDVFLSQFGKGSGRWMSPKAGMADYKADFGLKTAREHGGNV